MTESRMQGFAAGRYAAIDIGTVTCRMLVADVDAAGAIHEVDREYAITNLGEGVDATGMLLPAAIDRTVETVGGYCAVRDRLAERGAPIAKTIAVATSASRDAGNSDEFVRRLAELGVVLSVIPGWKEAGLSFSGASCDFPGQDLMVVDIGGGTTEVAVISLGGIVVSRSVRVGGIRMDAAIINFIKREFNMLIGDRTAEDVKFDLGAALPMNDVRRAFVRGRDLVTNLPQTAEITSTMVYEALKAPCQAILAAIQYVLERTPPELAGDVMRSGIHLTGGGALLCGMDRFIATELDMPVLLAKEPMDCAALGIGQLAEDLELLQRMCQSAPQRDDEEETTF